jgi:hypothetical protein
MKLFKEKCEKIVGCWKQGSWDDSTWFDFAHQPPLPNHYDWRMLHFEQPSSVLLLASCDFFFSMRKMILQFFNNEYRMMNVE